MNKTFHGLTMVALILSVVAFVSNYRALPGAVNPVCRLHIARYCILRTGAGGLPEPLPQPIWVTQDAPSKEARHLQIWLPPFEACRRALLQAAVTTFEVSVQPVPSFPPEIDNLGGSSSGGFYIVGYGEPLIWHVYGSSCEMEYGEDRREVIVTGPDGLKHLVDYLDGTRPLPETRLLDRDPSGDGYAWNRDALLKFLHP